MRLLKGIAVALMFLLVVLIGGCSLFEKNPVVRESDEAQTDIQLTPGDTIGPPDLARRGAAIYDVAWPFGPSENWYNWNGWEFWRDRTEGWSGSYCGGTRGSTHDGADLYARDLNRNDGNDYGKSVYAGFNGQVVQAISPNNWNGGYGGTVVIYDANRHVALRYSHLSQVAVSRGNWVSFGQYIGRLGNSGRSSGPHLHICAYENIDHFYSDGYPVIPNLCDSDWYTCAVYFICW